MRPERPVLLTFNARLNREIRDSRRHGLDPIPLRLTASPQQIEDELHRSMWDVAIGQSLDEPVDVLAEAAGVADSVDAAIGVAWSIRERARVHDTPPADGPDGPAAFRRRSGRQCRTCVCCVSPSTMTAPPPPRPATSWAGSTDTSNDDDH